MYKCTYNYIRAKVETIIKKKKVEKSQIKLCKENILLEKKSVVVIY